MSEYNLSVGIRKAECILAIAFLLLGICLLVVAWLIFYRFPQLSAAAFTLFVAGVGITSAGVVAVLEASKQ